MPFTPARLYRGDCTLDEFLSEDFLFALLLSVILEACAKRDSDELSSKRRIPYAHAIQILSAAGFIEIKSRSGRQISAQVTPLGKTLIERLHNG